MTRAEAAYADLRKDILEGRLTPSLPLRLEFLKTQYGFSFSPLREALNRLHAERLVINDPPRGFKVAPISPVEIKDVMQTRIIIETAALRQSIEKGGDDWETDLLSAFHRLDLQSKRINIIDGVVDDEALMLLETRHHEFHLAMLSACGSPRLLDLFEQLYMETQRYRLPSFLSAKRPDMRRDLSTEHSKIMKAALNRQVEEAVELLALHYEYTATDIIDAS